MEKENYCTFLYSSKVLQNTGQSDTSSNANETITGPASRSCAERKPPPNRVSTGEGAPIHQCLFCRIRDSEGIFSLAQVPKPSPSFANSGTYGAVFLVSLILRYIYCRLVCHVYTHTYANSNCLFNTHMCIQSSLDFTRLTSCR